MSNTTQFADIFVTITDKDGKILGQRNIFQQGVDVELAGQVMENLDNEFNVFNEFDNISQTVKDDGDWLANVP